ncbi:ferredoxin [Streptomyces caeruleatus]|uniref:Ferredoxin n=1 Tax=Streptomyces caeruleatus TaxID=661399 RepID=A0A101U8E4_9ACTN|nr:ferredoxin [Streptomyces caeruleatus]KUO05994.1 ferredoxin [Streptomyces caeruleatus]
MVRIAVDLNRCQGYAQCAFLAPEVFAMHGEEGLLYDPDVDEAQREKLARAAAACPVQAILVDAVDAVDVADAGDTPAEAVSGAR